MIYEIENIGAYENTNQLRNNINKVADVIINDLKAYDGVANDGDQYRAQFFFNSHCEAAWANITNWKMSEIISVTDKDIFYLFKLLYLLADDTNIQNHLTTAATTCDIPEECFEEITQHFQGMAKMQKARDILLEEIAIKNLLEENSIDYEKFSIAYANALRQL